MKQKTLLFTLLIASMLLSCTKQTTPVDGEEGSRILFNINTDESVDHITRSGNYSYLIELDGPETKSFQLTTPSVSVQAGQYNVTATTPVSYTLPAFNTPVYQDQTTVTVPIDGSAPANLTLTQINVGVRFVFHQSVRAYYDALVAKIEDKVTGQSLDFDYLCETAGKIAYFEPGNLNITLSDGGQPVLIGSENVTTISTKKKELWTITLKTSSTKPGDIEINITIDTDTDDQTGEWGIGEVVGEGTFAAPFSIGDAINAMPFSDRWIEGYVVGPATVVTRASDNAILIGETAGTEEDKCIVLEVASWPALAQFANPDYIGTKVKFRGGVVGSSPEFTTNAKAVLTNITDFDSQLRPTGVNGTEAITLSGHTLKDIAASGSDIFRMGATVKTDNLIKDGGAPAAYIDLVKRDFSSLTLEYEMKLTDQVKYHSDPITHGYRLQWLRKFGEFARDNNIDVHGHTLVWYKDWPADWEHLSNEEIKLKLEEYIESTMLEYSYVRSWDVVNEAFENADGTHRVDYVEGGITKPNLWYRAYGPDYIKEAFMIARRVAKENNLDVKLFYNDYKTEVFPRKRDAITEEIIRINQEYAAANNGEVLVDGIGLQMHIYAGIPREQLETAIDAALSTGGLIHISELSVALANVENDNAMDGVTITPEMRAKQMQTFNDLFNIVFTRVPKDRLWGITTWGLNDSYSIYSKREAMLFDKDFKAKRPYFDIINTYANNGATE